MMIMNSAAFVYSRE